MVQSLKPLLGFAAYSGTGKTTLLKQLLPLLRDKGYRVGVVKHAHHDFDIDKPGKDSYELRQAGANEMLVVSAKRWALMVETEDCGDPDLQSVIDRLNQDDIDLILVEGFKHDSFAKIELHRPMLEKPLMFPNDPDICAIATDRPLPVATELPVLDLNDVPAIADYVFERFLHAQGG